MLASNSPTFSASYSRTTRLKSPVTSVRTQYLDSGELAAASFNWAASLLALPGLAMKQFRTTIIGVLLVEVSVATILTRTDGVAPIATPSLHLWPGAPS